MAVEPQQVEDLDGDRLGSGEPAQIQVVLNWFEDLKMRVPIK